MNKLKLPDKESKAIRYIRNSLARSGQTPTIREIMIHLGYRSPRSAAVIIDQLISKGVLFRKLNGNFQIIKNIEDTEEKLRADKDDEKSAEAKREERLKKFKEGLAELINNLPLLGISGISNLLSAIKVAKYYEMTERDVIFTIATDSSDMYKSRIEELRKQYGQYRMREAQIDWERYLLGCSTDNMRELSYRDRKKIHNLKYFTWIEQQEKSVEDLNQLWCDKDIWDKIFAQVKDWDILIKKFNLSISRLCQIGSRGAPSRDI